jgi:hypothetical protein
MSTAHEPYMDTRFAQRGGALCDGADFCDGAGTNQPLWLSAR